MGTDVFGDNLFCLEEPSDVQSFQGNKWHIYAIDHLSGGLFILPKYLRHTMTMYVYLVQTVESMLEFTTDRRSVYLDRTCVRNS